MRSTERGVIESEPVSDAPAAIVTAHEEARMAERRHHLDHVERHRALGVVCMIGRVAGLPLSP